MSMRGFGCSGGLSDGVSCVLPIFKGDYKNN